MDKIFIRALEVEAVIGVYDWERKIKQRLLVDIEMGTDIRRAAQTDDLSYALNYFEISQRIKAFVIERQPQLIEVLAEELAAIIRTEFQVPWLRLSITKPTAVMGAQAVGVVIERGHIPL